MSTKDQDSPQAAARRREIERLRNLNRGGWDRQQADAYLTATREFTANEIGKAVTALMDDWTAGYWPKPAILRNQCQAARASERQVKQPGEGAGCPRCRVEQTPRDWWSDGQIVHCRTHDVGWQGSLPERDEPTMTLHEYAEVYGAESLGEVLNAVLKRGGDFIDDVAKGRSLA